MVKGPNILPQQSLCALRFFPSQRDRSLSPPHPIPSRELSKATPQVVERPFRAEAKAESSESNDGWPGRREGAEGDGPAHQPHLPLPPEQVSHPGSMGDRDFEVLESQCKRRGLDAINPWTACLRNLWKFSRLKEQFTHIRLNSIMFHQF